MHDATNFWLLAGTAAPVIALANLVLLGDTSKQIFDFLEIRRNAIATPDQKTWARNGLRPAQVVAIASYANLVGQTFVLAQALEFFAIGHSGSGATAIQLILEFGMIVLIIVSLISSYVRHTAAEVKAAADSEKDTPVAAKLDSQEGTGVAAELERLAALHSSGALDAEEFRAAKARIIHGG
jgi:hypothetical protein